MARSKFTPVFAALIAITLFFGGMASYKLLAGTGATARTVASIGQKPLEGIGIQGKVEIRVYSSSGRLLTTWKGHNSLGNYAKNGIAGCLSGATTAPPHYASCSGPWINAIQICPSLVSPGTCIGSAATNTTVTLGCIPNPFCTGWQSTATIPIFATTTYDHAIGGTSTQDFDFVTISPSLSLNAGDTAVVTITFMIS